ncbi:MAG TPA: hypothetical protein VFK41_00205 [Nocardioidaceae bacterium]|nr:hypothetical protein [Nocardioidaceae bacterium]
MKRYADPLRCPDCNGPIAYGEEACRTCSLPLQGAVAQELYATLTHADQLLVSLRASAVRPARPEPPPAPETTTVFTPAPPSRVPSTRTGMTTASVPKILLTLGAGCLLVAALVFLAVTWSVMGVGGRTATLVGFTVLSGTLTAVLARKSLRGAVESLGLVTLGLLTLDVVGADNAGWLGDPSVSTFSVLLGGILVLAATSACLALRRTPSGAFSAGEVVVGLGTGIAAAGLAAGEWGSAEGRLLVATLVAGGVVVLLDRVSLEIATVCAGAVALLPWITLGLAGFDRITSDPTLTGVWADGGAWPALAAAAIVAGLAAVGRLPLAVRQLAASVAAAIAAFVVVAAGLDEGATEAAVIALAVLTGATLVLALPKPWNATAWVALASGAAGVVGSAAYLLVTAGLRWVDEVAERGLIGDRMPAADLELQPWLLPLAVASLLAAVVVALRPTGWKELLPSVAAFTTVATVALYPVPVLLLVGLCLVGGVGFLVRRELEPTVLLLLAGLVLALHSDGLAAVALAVVLGAGWWTHVREEREELTEAGALVAQLALAGSLWTWGLLLDQPGTWVAALGTAAVPLVAIVRRSVGLEVGAALGMVGLVLAGVSVAPGPETNTWIAVYLTVAGVATCAHALLRDDRRELGWVGGLLLAAATWVRLSDLGVTQPEPYTLPSAVALLVVGLVHLRRHSSSATVPALGAGLSLALVPSLLWVLDDPQSPRTVLLGLACLALVVAGVQARWTAPLTFGAAIGSLVVLRLAAPYLSDSSVPRWVLLGLAGTLLVAMGVTWEQRVNEARRALGYVRSLR